MAALAGTVGLAALFPASGTSARFAAVACDLAVALLFFLYGARLSTRETLAGLRHLRLHGLVLAATFLLFPLLGVATALLTPVPLTGQLHTGVLFLCLVPSTVQSSVALTGAAGGNVPAAICAGTYSSLAGLVLTPLLAAWLLGSHTALSADGLLRIGLQLLAPFLLGQLLRPWLGGPLSRHKRVLTPVDRGSILMVVYTAFSAAVSQGILGLATPSRCSGCSRCCSPCSPPPSRPPGSARGCWGSTGRPPSRRCSAVRRRAWPTACRWPPSCSARKPACWCCR